MSSPVPEAQPQPARVLVFSPPPKIEQHTGPSEFLLLKPFSKAPSLQIKVSRPGKSKAAVLSVQNIDDNPSRLYFEIPTDKRIQIRPEAIVIQPQSIESFEVIAVEPKDSFRATIKVFAPQIKYYRGGQFHVSVDVQEAPKVEKKKRQKPSAPIIRPKAVTVPKEFKFQPSREERKKVITREDQGQKDNIFLQNLMVEQTFNDTSVDLENIRRQTVILKHQIDANQTYLIPSPIVQSDFSDPLTFIRHTLGPNRSLGDIAKAVASYVSFAKSRNLLPTLVSEQQKQRMNEILLEHQPAIMEGSLSLVLTLLQSFIPSTTDATEGDSGLTSKLSEVQVSEPPQTARAATMATSSPKRDSSEMPGSEKEPPLERQTTSLLSDCNRAVATDQIFNNESMNVVKSPDVSAIFPINLNF